MLVYSFVLYCFTFHFLKYRIALVLLTPYKNLQNVDVPGQFLLSSEDNILNIGEILHMIISEWHYFSFTKTNL